MSYIMKQEMREVLDDNILSFWLKMQDHENEGFYGQMRGDGTLVKTADKGGILNARILWSFSASYRVTKNPAYLEAATRAKDYILKHFIDREFGGTYWKLDYLGNPIDTKKQFYAIGFTIYGLSEYARATGDKEALNVAIALYHCIEEHSLDKEYGGYIEACTREWNTIKDMRLSDLDANYPKSQNTHLHIIEAYTNLYRCIKQQEAPTFNLSTLTIKLEQSIRNLIDIFTDKILNPETHHLDLFFDMAWKRSAERIDSYGHDIECSWLLHEAALVLGDNEVLAKIKPLVLLIAKASEEGLNADGSLSHEATYNLTKGCHVDDNRHWWVQAENVVGWINIYQLFHEELATFSSLNEGEALQKAEAGWKYIKDNLIDHQLGEWYWSCDRGANINRTDDHAGFWKCPYHNSRMCLEIIEREF